MNLFARWRRDRSLARHLIPEAEFDAAVERLPILCGLTEPEFATLREHASLLIANKTFSAAGGASVTADVQHLIAVQASLLTLKLGEESWRGWEEIILYPAEFLRTREETDAAGVVHVNRDILSGEAWHGGPLVLSTSDVYEAGQGHGFNVVLHEFAHKLDMLSGDANGQPPLHRGMDTKAWAVDLGRAYYDLCARADRGEDTEIDPYATTNPAEFFAVTSEAFFETPDVLIETYPDVYKQYRAFYRQHPLARLEACVA